MAAIPVPVHFDGHNINIITEDSPSTCKSRTKGVNYGKKSNNKNKKRNNNSGKAQVLNKRAPSSTTSASKASTSSSNGDILVISPLPSSSNKENIDECNQREAPLLNGTIAKSKSKSKPSETQTAPNLKVAQSPNQMKIANKVTNVHASNHKAAHHHHNSNPIHHLATGALNHRKPSRLPQAVPPRNQRHHPQAVHAQQIQTHAAPMQTMVDKQNETLIANGLDPNEFGSHDDVGFDDGENNNQGKDRQNLYKTELCREWSTSGWCYYNKRCSFAHGLQELRPVFRSKKWRTKRCRNWHTTGYCPYEHRCQFLHDQSPPRRISDYATANARALVAAQQRMQPLYFHYQVDCDRDESGEENVAANRSKENTPNNTLSLSPKTQSVGPRLKRKEFRNHLKNNMNKAAPLRMVQQNRKNGKANKAIGGKANKTIGGKKKRNKSRTPQGRNQQNNNISVPNNKQMKNKKKKQKDAVITPFNPVSATYGATPQSFELAAQQLGLYNPAASQLIPNQNPGLALQGISSLPPIPVAGGAFQGLPPSIDPSLYLSLTPSPPPHSPVAVKEMNPMMSLQQLKKQGDGQTLGAVGLNVEVPPSLTPSPPTVPADHNANIDSLTQHQQVQIQLAKQQQTLQVLHAKVQEVAQQQAAQHAEQQATVAALLSRASANKSTSPVAPIDGGLLESLLPTDDNVDNNATKSAGNTQKTIEETASIPNITTKSDTCTRLTSKAIAAAAAAPSSEPNRKSMNTASFPPIPPIPPPLQLQTSINSVVTGAVAAAMTPTGVHSLAMTPRLIDPSTMNQTTNINQLFGYPKQANINIPYTQGIDIQSLPNIQTHSAYQQTHTAHAAYTSAQQTTAYHIQPATYNAAAPRVSYGPPQPQYPTLGLPVGFTPFYAPSPDLQEIPQYYSSGYAQPRHHY